MDICIDRVKTPDQDTPRHTAWKLRLRVAKHNLTRAGKVKRHKSAGCMLADGRQRQCDCVEM